MMTNTVKEIEQGSVGEGLDDFSRALSALCVYVFIILKLDYNSFSEKPYLVN